MYSCHCPTPLTDEISDLSERNTFTNNINKLSDFDGEESESSTLIPKSQLENILKNVCWTVSGLHEESETICSSISTSSDSFESIEPEDQRLVNWKCWLENRKAQVKKISKFTGKHPANILMNNLEEFREIKENREILNYMQTLVNEDQNRGADIKFWKIPEKLRTVNCLADCFLTLPLCERMNKPLITYTKSPNVILEEKDLKKEPRKYSWLQSEYFKRKIKKQNDLFPLHVPQLAEIAIKGTEINVNYRDNEFNVLLTPNSELQTEEQKIVSPIKAEQVLMLNETLLDTDSFSMKQNKFNFAFEADILNEKKIERIILKNISESSLRFDWIPPKKLDLKIGEVIPGFYFNKNSFSLIAGESCTLNIIFCPKIYRIYSENWTLKMTKDREISFNLFGYCSSKDMTEKLYKLDKEINLKSSKLASEMILNKIIKDSISVPITKPIYANNFLDEDLFKLENSELNFHYSSVEALKQIYQEICVAEGDCINWNFNSLRYRILCIEDERKRRIIFEKFRQNIYSLKNPNYTNFINYDDQKFLLVRNIITLMITKFEENSFELRKKIFHTNHDLTFHETIVRRDNSEFVVKTEQIKNKMDSIYKESLFVQTYFIIQSAINEIISVIQ